VIYTEKNTAPEGLRALAAAIAAQQSIELRQVSPDDETDVTPAVRDCWTWLSQFTETKDNHWVEAGFPTPYRPFPQKPYFQPVLEEMDRESVLFIEKSRDLMISWSCVGFFTHKAQTTPQREVLFQSQKEEKAWELIEYAKVLYARQHPKLRERFPLSKPLNRQPVSSLEFANGSILRGIPEGADQVRSYHPWGLLMDEAAFQPKAGESYDHSVSVCQKIIVLSSVGPGWFSDFATDNR